ncbi:hypothetical protein CY34DRAFT_475476 [Suillus luteus UH-Slu-Lm8-n1]|uniref:Uncharacterized protein n=1 Tax=Suillus luteus UH-Slu-Lm8-n1 TaxID=930992 RepID=A0A0D0AG76_9AGAM|nr:hypothetical protein CY34DRAFT_475476 [Suillus luteus UH-Slu-Lm8-n1]
MCQSSVNQGQGRITFLSCLTISTMHSPLQQLVAANQNVLFLQLFCSRLLCCSDIRLGTRIRTRV